MVPSHIDHGKLKSLKDAHDDLHAPIERLRAVVNQRSDGPVLAEALTQLQNELARHFELEEADGYLDDAVAHTPVLMRRACDLLQEHSAIRQELKDLIDRVQRTEPTEAWWDEFCCRFDQFMLILLDHEASEHQFFKDASDWDL